jgi:hypothetical protein
MKFTTREKHWLRVFIVLCAIMPVLVLFSSPGQWIPGAGVWLLLALAIRNGLLWLGLAAALAAVNQAPTVGMMMGGGKEGGGMGMKGMGMMGGMGGKDSPQGGGMCCCEMMMTMMKGQQQKAPTTQSQHSHDHK